MNQKLLIIGLLVIAVVGLPLMVFFFQQQQTLKSRATQATTLSFSPSSSATTPIAKQVGDTLSVDIVADPGINALSTIVLELSYNPTIFSGTASTFVINSSAFPQTLEGPFIDTTNGKILATISVGSDPTKAITIPTTIGTVTLKATKSTAGTPTQISFGPLTQALSVGSGDQAAENVLSTPPPAYIIVAEIPTPTPTPTATPTPTPTPTPVATKISVTTFLHGIGSSGDNANPTSSSLSNKNPLQKIRNVTVSLFDNNNQLILSKGGTVNYSSGSGNFTGIVDMGTSLLGGNYIIKVKSDRLLQRRIPGILAITPETTITIPQVTLITGDADNNNLLNILDYNMLIGCYSDLLPPISCTTQAKTNTDFNDDSKNNHVDYNLFVREISVQAGD